MGRVFHKPSIQDGDKTYGESLSIASASTMLQLQRVNPRPQPHRHTLNVSITPAKNFIGLWDGSQITIQIELSELPAVAAVLLGLREVTEHKFHGDDRTKLKGFDVKNREEYRGWGLFTQGTRLDMPLSNEDMFWLAEFTVATLAANTHCRTITDVMNLIRQTMR